MSQSEAVEIAEAIGSKYSQIWGSAALGMTYFLKGDHGVSEETSDALSRRAA
jgi:hypothetical protein